jgi:hypothetical protein
VGGGEAAGLAGLPPGQPDIGSEGDHPDGIWLTAISEDRHREPDPKSFMVRFDP